MPGKCYGQRSLEATVHGIAKELDTTEHAGTQRSLPGSLQSILFTATMASGPITSCEIDGERVETVSDFTSLGSKITADSDCSNEIKRYLLLGRQIMMNLDSILKSRDITLKTKVIIVKAMVFLVVMYRCESWTIKKLEGRRIDAFKTL